MSDIHIYFLFKYKTSIDNKHNKSDYRIKFNFLATIKSIFLNIILNFIINEYFQI